MFNNSTRFGRRSAETPPPHPHLVRPKTRRTRAAQPEEGIEITEPEDDGEAVEDDGSHRPQRPGACRADRDHVGVPREKRGAPPIPHYCHFGVAILRGFGVVEDTLAVALQPPPGIVVNQLEPPVGPVAHVDVFDVGRIAAGVGIAAAHFRSCDYAGCPCWTCVFPSKPEGDTHYECSDGQNGNCPFASTILKPPPSKLERSMVQEIVFITASTAPAFKCSLNQVALPLPEQRPTRCESFATLASEQQKSPDKLASPGLRLTTLHCALPQLSRERISGSDDLVVINSGPRHVLVQGVPRRPWHDASERPAFATE